MPSILGFSRNNPRFRVRWIAAGLLLLAGIAALGGLILWQDGYLGQLPVQIRSDQRSWEYYNQHLRRSSILYPAEPWHEYLGVGARKIVSLWVPNESGVIAEFGVEVKSSEPISYSALIAKLVATGSAYNLRTGANCVAFNLSPNRIANVPMLLTLKNSPGLYLHSYIITSRMGSNISCNPTTGLLDGSGTQVARQILYVSGGSLTQE